MSVSAAKNVEKDLSSAPPNGFNFKEGEKVLCYHGPLIYFAKCMQARYDKATDVVEYHIHYSGWNKSWDEWVPETRVLKINDENLQKQKDLHKAQKSEMVKKKKRNKSIPSTISSPDASSQNISGTLLGSSVLSASFSNTSLDSIISSPSEIKSPVEVKVSTPVTSVLSQDVSESGPKRKKSRISESSSSQDDQSSTKVTPSYMFNISDKLKALLTQDWLNVDQNKKLVKLPVTHSVDSIIDDFIQELLAKDPQIKSSEKELVKGVSDYFNAFINPSLLYQMERLQYDEILKDDPNVCVTKVYGVIHLLRLLVKFPKKLADFSLLSKQRVDHILTKIEPFVQFIDSNIEKYTSDTEYESPSPDYLSKAVNYMVEE